MPKDEEIPLEVQQNVGNFGITVQEISEMMARRDLNTLAKLGNTAKITENLHSDIKHGLPKEEEASQYKDRITVFGTNNFNEPPRKNFFMLCLNTFKDTTMIILTIAATVSLILGLIPPEALGAVQDDSHGDSWIEGVAIYIAILIVSTVTGGNEYSKDGQFRELNKTKRNFPVKVIRGGVDLKITAFEVLVGDLVILDTGDQIPADGLFISGFDMYVNESAVTGEPDAVRKSENKDPFLLSGCTITDGVGRMMVIATGMNSEWGKTLSKLQEEPEDTPLQKKLDGLAVLIGKVGTGVSILVFLVLTAWWVAIDVAGQEWNWGKINTVVRNFIIAVTIIVVAVPEGLPLAVTISLAYSMKQMMQDNNLVRHLSACETMGGATNICSDKTGTLTENRMTVVEGWAGGNDFVVPPAGFQHPFTPEFHKIFVEGICVNTKDSTNVKQEPGMPVEFIGNPTECALLVFVGKLGVEYANVREHNHVYQMFPFSSARKRMSSIVAKTDQLVISSPKKKKKNDAPPADGYRLYTKGASEIILKRCVKYLTPEAQPVDLPDEIRQKLNEKIDYLANLGLRTLTIAYREIDKLKKWKDPPEEELTLIGVVGIMDPLRKLVPEAVRACQYAGIKVRMVTGDNIKTAKKIASDCGILSEGETALEGPDFAKMDDRELDKVLPTLSVLARATPMDKYRLVDRLKQNGEVVAVTGDGTNDAPALKKADVGLAMGIMGTEVAKEASDIIILDDNFVSIVRSVMWGRNVYDNIRKFLQFQLTINLVALLVAFIGAITRYGTPLTAVQLLWVNLIMDTLAALALGTERPTADLLNKKPYGRHSRLISRIMLRNIIGNAIFQASVMFMILYAGPEIWNLRKPAPLENEYERGEQAHGPTAHYTMVFNTFVLLQVFNEVNSRKLYDINVFKGLLSNWIFVGVLLFTAAGQALITEFGGKFTSTTHLNVVQWFSCIGLAALMLPVGFIVKCFPVELESFEVPTSAHGSEEMEFLTQSTQVAKPSDKVPLTKAQV